MHRLLSGLLGLERKEKVAGSLAKIGIMNRQRRKSIQMQKLLNQLGMGNKKKIAFVILSDPMMYPPTMNAASILAENGYAVDVIGLKYDSDDKIHTSEGVNLIYRGCLKGGIVFRLKYLEMLFWLAFRALRKKYFWIFCYNHKAIFPVYIASRVSGSKWLYHNHDISITKKRWGFYPLLKWLEKSCARRADIVAFPQAERAECFAEEAKLLRKPLIVMNGPRMNWSQIEGIHPEIDKLKKRFGKVVLYQGGLNWKRGLRQVIQSMPYWKPQAGLCLIGTTNLWPSFPIEANKLARELGVNEKLLILPTVPYNELPMITNHCDIGLSVMSTLEQDDNINIQFLAGASNKLAEYMACGLPLVVPDTAEYRKMIRDKDLGVLVDCSDPVSIAEGINRLLDSEKLYSEASMKVREAFEKIYNYETQFEKVLNAINNQSRCPKSRG